MALATQCPHCYTTFRVANDQLKLHAGLVRCGACQQTFNGIEHLLAPGAKPAVPAPAVPALAPAVTSAVEPAPVQPEIEEPAAIIVAIPPTFTPVQVPIPEITPAAESPVITPFGAVENDHFPIRAETTHLDLSQIDSNKITSSTIGNDSSSISALDFDLGYDEPVMSGAPVTPHTEAEAKAYVTPQTTPDEDEDDEDQLGLLTQVTLINGGIDATPIPQLPIQQPESRLEPSFSDIPDTEVIVKEDVTASELESAAAEYAVFDAEVTADATSETDLDEEKPTFVVQAEKKQRRSRLVRILMTVASILLFFALLAQITYSLRNHLAAWFPQTKPLLQQACKPLQCRIELLTQIEVISIESNELQALSNDKNIFSLSIQLQNKSNTLQAWPMLELILNDAKDKPVLQRVFPPADYLTNKNDLLKGFAPNSEQTIKLYFELSGPKAAGYHVGVFYP